MPYSASRTPLTPDALNAAIEAACATMAPAWPLDRSIAVNPLWGFTEQTLSDTAQALSARAGMRLLMSREALRKAFETHAVSDRTLREAAEAVAPQLRSSELRSALTRPRPQPATRALVVDLADARRDAHSGQSWRSYVRDHISTYCAAYFDQGQATTAAPREEGLYASWRAHAARDLRPKWAMGLRQWRSLAAALPEDPDALVAEAVETLGLPAQELEAYFGALLLDINGWSSWCAYLNFMAQHSGQQDGHLRDLLVIRLAWELLLLRHLGTEGERAWRTAMTRWPFVDQAHAEAQQVDWVLQEAVERSYQQRLCEGLRRPATARAERPELQAVFCIDVRSEVLRRALEAQHPGIETRGFAGFFGLPIAHEPLGTSVLTPQLPGLLAPQLVARETSPMEGLEEARQRRLALGSAWKTLKRSAISGFSFVESFGLGFGAKLLTDSLGLSRPVSTPGQAALTATEAASCDLHLTALDSRETLPVAQRVKLAATVLRAMGLTDNFARLVLLAGHGSATTNNPHAAGLDCGACCGQSGAVNARALAGLLNDTAVRDSLRAEGIDIPDDTHFVAGLHNTTTDELKLLSGCEACAEKRALRTRVAEWLAAAAVAAREERLARFGGQGASRAEAEARARDWAELRPEWGLAGNAAFIVAPRARSRHLNLEGRSFLHDYSFAEDPEAKVLELIMTAPMLVTHWINFQYYASTVDNARLGSGNKVLHNVIGGRIGVFEGQAGDLRVGLPLQCIHDGEDFVHEALRLSVFIEAPRDAISAIIAKHSKVRDLVDKGWLHLLQLDADSDAIHRYQRGIWLAV